MTSVTEKKIQLQYNGIIHINMIEKFINKSRKCKIKFSQKTYEKWMQHLI